MTIDPAHTATTATGYTPAPEVTYDAPASREVVPATPQAVGHDQVRVDVTEHPAWSIPGGLGLLCVLGLFLGGAGMVALGAAAGGDGGAGWQIALGGFLVVLSMLAGSSLTIVQPGETKVLQFLGRYVGTVRNTGIQLTLPFTDKSKVSVKVRNFETHELKVNDADGNPVNIAAIIVWQVADTAKSRFAVENYEHFVQVYDNAQPGEETLRGSTDLVAAELADEVAARVAIAGIEIVEARISSLAYAPEIAQAMLQRQQAAALLAARAMIVEGAVGMVESALRRLESDNIVAMDEVRKAEMVSNLLVVLCGETRATPVINTGYSTR
jgi:hypothetical protein